MLKIGDTAPEFELRNQNGDLVRLSDYRGKKVILFAFPKAGTPGCNNQACAFRDEFTSLTSSNAVVFGVSNDTIDDLRRWKEAKKLPYDLLSDASHAMLTAYGAWGMGVGIIKLPFITRSVWVIDENGTLIDMQIGVNPRASVERAIKALEMNAAAL